MSRPERAHAPYLWPVGEGGLVAPERVIAAGRWDSAPIRRKARAAQAAGRLIDLTFGRACKWVLFLDTDHVALVAVPMPVAVIDDAEFEQFLIETYGE